MPDYIEERNKQKIMTLRAEVAQKRPMALFLGSGVSRGWGLPLWDELCSCILARAIEARDAAMATITRERAVSRARLYSRLFPDGPLAIMQYAGDLLGPEFAEVVRTVLYERWEKPKGEPSLLEVLSRVIASETVLRDIVTYNYDDLLERMLSDERALNVQSVTCGEDLGVLDRSRNDVMMYYVHGRVPSRPGDRTSANVVATEGEYFELRQRELDWRNLVQLQILTTRRALFLGLSLSDPNLRWLMKTCFRETKRTHYAVDLAESPKSLRENIKRMTGTGCSVDTANALVSLRMEARERLGRHLGIEFLWLNDWDDLSRMIEMIFAKP